MWIVGFIRKPLNRCCAPVTYWRFKNFLLAQMSEHWSAPLVLIGFAEIAEPADLRRGVSNEDVANIGWKVAAGMNMIKKVLVTHSKALWYY